MRKFFDASITVAVVSFAVAVMFCSDNVGYAQAPERLNVMPKQVEILPVMPHKDIEVFAEEFFVREDAKTTCGCMGPKDCTCEKGKCTCQRCKAQGTGCLCGCVQTGKCVCPNCDHPVKGTPTGPGCTCGCVKTGNCVCKDCNHPKNDDLSYKDAAVKAVKDNTPLVVFVGCKPIKVQGCVTTTASYETFDLSKIYHTWVVIGKPDGKGDLTQIAVLEAGRSDIKDAILAVLNPPKPVFLTPPMQRFAPYCSH